MQVSIYLDESLIRRVDRRARREKRSRSEVVSELLSEALRQGPRSDRAGRLKALAGSWMDERSPEEIVEDVYARRTSGEGRAELA
ncbi:MAG: hypothetical protein A3G34_16355 [Candidatus Lindowbacteria bacterium RIFCSPLOWO2_12_FULL_62_27]|nr:MAG: hypothetical protein A3G34_16355 [Candidatus Lindowbacteria bacterium RIFCSPLOWO2_12_FULL_62_27]